MKNQKRTTKALKCATGLIMAMFVTFVSAGCTVNINTGESDASKVDAQELADRELDGDDIFNYTKKDWETKGAQICLRISDALVNLGAKSDDPEFQVSEWYWGSVTFPYESEWKAAEQLIEHKNFVARLQLDPSISTASQLSLSDSEYQNLLDEMTADYESRTSEACSTVGVELQFG
jgi:hypothetical protein